MYTTDCSDYKEYLAQYTSRFVSEEPTFGAICRESMLEFMTEDDLVGEDESILKYHSKTTPGLPVHIYDDIRAVSEHVLGEFCDGEDRYFKMKYIQCEWVRITEELVLRNLGYSNGIIYWMFNDCWPASLGWAFVDYYLRRKPSFYAFKRLSVPVVGSVDAEGRTLTVSNTSDDGDAAFVTVLALDMKDGFNEVGRIDTSVILDPYSTEKIDVSDIKEDPLDFAVWKAAKPGEPYWDSPWGKGRPGWHIECSAMSQKFLGSNIDIHAGGEDLAFPHHENEIAQSESYNCCTGCADSTFTKIWLHNAYILTDGQKMSKSGISFKVRDAAAKYSYEAIRFFIISAHYRSPVNYSEEAMHQAQVSVERFHTCEEILSFRIKA